MRILELRGTAKAMGEAFGETCREEIQQFYELRLENAIAQALQHGGRNVNEAEALKVAELSLPITESYDPEGYKELMAIGHASNLGPERVFCLNQLTDLRDVLAWGGDLEIDGGCTSFVVRGDLTKDGKTLLGQTWDLATNNKPYVLAVVRKPKDGPETHCLTTVGCLSLIGMNEEGVSIGTTNIRMTDARPGVGYLSIIHKVLAQKSLSKAAECVTNAHRAGGHYYYVADGAGQAAAFECSATVPVRKDIEQGEYVQTNHVQSEELLALEANTPASSSQHRCPRMSALIQSAKEGIDVEMVQAFLGDTENDENAISRDDFNGISTNGAVVMSPEDKKLWMIHGLPRPGEWTELG